MVMKNALLRCSEEQNTMMPDNSTIFDEPLTGVVQAGDQLFVEFLRSDIIGPHFRTPGRWLPGAVAVISYFLPFSSRVRLSNQGEGPSSEEWLHGRFRGEIFNDRLRYYITKEIARLGGRAVAPGLENSFFADYDALTSNWSERHVAYAAGLGSFGLHRGLITEKGVAGRFGSVVTDLEFASAVRPQGSYYQNCPFLINGSCGACIKRCPAGAITDLGKDKRKCYQFIFIEDRLKGLREKYNYPYSICGKCQVAVPCEERIP